MQAPGPFNLSASLIQALDEHAIVAVTDARGRICHVNDLFCRISQYSRDELLGQDHRLINSGLHPREMFADLWSTIARGQVWRGEIRNRAKDRSFYWVQTTIVPFLRPDGRPDHFVALRTDITQRKLAEESLRLRTEELARSNHDLEQFAYIASHDLQEPLRAVAGCTQLLQQRYQEKLDARADELITHVVDGANRMRTLIDDLLAYSRVGTRGARLEPVPADTALNSALANLSHTIRETGAVITREPLPTVTGDPTQLTQLFQNLLANALKFRRADPPRIHIDTLRTGTSWTFRVQDNGIGIEPHHTERIFGIFQRLHTRREYPGTGIGLALCRRIVERHGGRIWVEAQPGEGSTFLFVLPANDQNNQSLPHS